MAVHQTASWYTVNIADIVTALLILVLMEISWNVNRPLKLSINLLLATVRFCIQ
jgi:hypothetical protein